MYNYNLEVCKLLKNAEAEARNLKHSNVGLEHLLLSLLKNDSLVSNYLSRYNLDYDGFLRELKLMHNNTYLEDSYILYSTDIKRVLRNISKKTDIDGFYLLKLILEIEDSIVIRLLINMNIDIDGLYENLKFNNKKENKNLEIYKIGKNLMEVADGGILVGRDKEIREVIEVLIRKNKNNPLLVGSAGVGKTAIVEELARRINKGLVPDKLKDKVIISLEMSSLVSGTKYRGEFEEKLGNIIKELESNPNIILFIDEIHTISNAGGAEGAINASDMLKPYLARGTIKLLGATTYQEYNKFIRKDKALDRRFELIRVSEPNEDDTINILTKLIPIYEKHYNIKITKNNIKDIVYFTNKYMPNLCNPDKSIDLLDSICASVIVDNTYKLKTDILNNKILDIIKQKNKMVSENNFKSAMYLREEELKINRELNKIKESIGSINKKMIKEVLYRKCNIVAYDKKVFDKLKVFLNNKIECREDSINKLCNTLKNNTSLVSVLLMGSEEKNKVVLELAKYLNMNVITINATRYSDSSSLNQLLGAPSGYVGYDDEAVFDKLKVNPQSIILIDNIDKASSSLINLIISILDNGYITTSKGEIINFTNTYIFMISNEKINNSIGYINNTKKIADNELETHISEVINI